MKHARLPTINVGRVLIGVNAVFRRLDTNHLDIHIVEEWMEKADRIRPASDRNAQQVRQAALQIQHLCACFIAPSLDRGLGGSHRASRRCQHQSQGTLRLSGTLRSG